MQLALFLFNLVINIECYGNIINKMRVIEEEFADNASQLVKRVAVFGLILMNQNKRSVVTG